jgi:hypothetical protein
MKTLSEIAAAALCLTALTVPALTWQSPNRPDASTIALFHFDEGSGAVTRSADSSRAFNLNSGLYNWTAAPTWMATPSGTCLTGTNTITGSQTVGASAAQYELDWSLPAITFSYWIRDGVYLDQNNAHFFLGYDGWRNMQVYIGHHRYWNPPSYLLYAGSGAWTSWQWDLSSITDGLWHHMAFVGVRGGDGQTTLKYYIDNVQRNFTVGGVPQATVTFTPVYTTSIYEWWSVLAGSAGSIDELLIQASEITDFSNGYNSVVPADPTTVLFIR